MRPNTKLVWIETPSNPLLRVVDIAAVAKIAHGGGAVCAVDNTWGTPVLQRPLDLGADVSMHSTTKYLGGHSDVLGGALILRENGDLSQRMTALQMTGGAVPSPFECWLTMRGIRTMPLRVRAQTATAGALAEFLAKHPKVEAVHYPGLTSHPAHAIAKRQMAGFGGMLSVQAGANREASIAIASRLACSPRRRASAAPRVSSSIARPSKARARARRKTCCGCRSASSMSMISSRTSPPRSRTDV